jgi:hypothetical protein
LLHHFLNVLYVLKRGYLRVYRSLVLFSSGSSLPNLVGVEGISESSPDIVRYSCQAGRSLCWIMFLINKTERQTRSPSLCWLTSCVTYNIDQATLKHTYPHISSNRPRFVFSFVFRLVFGRGRARHIVDNRMHFSFSKWEASPPDGNQSLSTLSRR